MVIEAAAANGNGAAAAAAATSDGGEVEGLVGRKLVGFSGFKVRSHSRTAASIQEADRLWPALTKQCPQAACVPLNSSCRKQPACR
jgi:hypothetical protein